MRMGDRYGSSPVMRSYMSNRFPYFSRTTASPSRAITSAKSRYTPLRSGPTPRPWSTTVLALRDATSRGTRLPNAGYFSSRK